MKTLIAGLLTALLLSGCANGWPRARHSLHAANKCVPTTSRIDRSDCNTTTPGTAASEEDVDRQSQMLQNGMKPPTGKGF